MERETSGSKATDADAWPATRTAVIRDAAGIGLAVGALGLSFGALSVVEGLTVAQTCVLSLLMFTGASQFALIGVLGAGGGAFAGAAAATLLGVRNSFYGLHLSLLLRVRGVRKAVAAHFVMDETTAMAVGRESPRAARLGFWATGFAIFFCWNIATLIGALAVRALPDPAALGLDVAAPAAFIALLAPRLRSQRPWFVALAAVAIALLAVPLVPAGIPVLLAAFVAVVAGLTGGRSASQPAVPDGADRTDRTEDL